MKQRQCCDLRSDARVLILSQRAWNRVFYIPPVYEFEDVVATIDNVDILAGRVAQLGQHALRVQFARQRDGLLPGRTAERKAGHAVVRDQVQHRMATLEQAHQALHFGRRVVHPSSSVHCTCIG